MKYTILPILAAGLLPMASSHAAVIAQWDTEGFLGSEATVPSSSVPTGLSVTAISLGSELTSSAGAGGINTTSWSTALNTTGNNYYGFSITVAASYQLDLATWEFTARSTNTGPGNFVVRYSGDSFASNIDTFSTSGDLYGNVIVDLSSLAILSAGTYEFRVGLLDTTQSDGVGVVTAGGNHRIMNFDSTTSAAGPTPINLNGTIAAIPEPTAAVLGSLGILGLLRRRRF